MVADNPTAATGDSQDPLRTFSAGLNPADAQFAVKFIDRLLDAAREARVSDLHLQPTAQAIVIRARLDGVLREIGRFPREIGPNLVARLKVLAELLTYRTDIPQEGRIRIAAVDVEMRISTFPTLFGERAVVRLIGGKAELLRIADLGLPAEIADGLTRLLDETAGALLLTGPAGSGKTTTIYACLRELAARSAGGRSLVTMEDPIEAVIEPAAQSQVNPSAGFTLASGLRSLLRQDPDVILVGEIRDRETAEGVFQASLTGHLVLTTFHAGSAAGAISRLADMGIEPYLLRSGLLAIVGQRLVRMLCDCGRASAEPADFLGVPVDRCRLAVGCQRCAGSGYRGRSVLAEMLVPDTGEIGRAILSRSDAHRIEELAIGAGMATRWERARQAVATGLTSPAEVRRVLGMAVWPGAQQQHASGTL